MGCLKAQLMEEKLGTVKETMTVQDEALRMVREKATGNVIQTAAQWERTKVRL